MLVLGLLGKPPHGLVFLTRHACPYGLTQDYTRLPRQRFREAVALAMEQGCLAWTLDRHLALVAPAADLAVARCFADGVAGFFTDPPQGWPS